jgi:hypothetical protein
VITKCSARKGQMGVFIISQITEFSRSKNAIMHAIFRISLDRNVAISLVDFIMFGFPKQ